MSQDPLDVCKKAFNDLLHKYNQQERELKNERYDSKAHVDRIGQLQSEIDDLEQKIDDLEYDVQDKGNEIDSLLAKLESKEMPKRQILNLYHALSGRILPANAQVFIVADGEVIAEVFGEDINMFTSKAQYAR